MISSYKYSLYATKFQGYINKKNKNLQIYCFRHTVLRLATGEGMPERIRTSAEACPDPAMARSACPSVKPPVVLKTALPSPAFALSSFHLRPIPTRPRLRGLLHRVFRRAYARTVARSFRWDTGCNRLELSREST